MCTRQHCSFPVKYDCAERYMSITYGAVGLFLNLQGRWRLPPDKQALCASLEGGNTMSILEYTSIEMLTWTVVSTVAAVIMSLIAAIKFGLDLYDRYKQSKENNNRSDLSK